MRAPKIRRDSEGIRMKRRDFLYTLPAIASTPNAGLAQTGTAPLWSSATSFTIQQGKTYALTLMCSDPRGLPLVFTALSTLPFGVSLDKTSGALSVGSTTSTGTYGVRFRAFNGIVAADSPFMTLAISAAPVIAEPEPQPASGPVPNASLTITATWNFKKDLYIQGGAFWNKYQVDKREGIIGWCDGDHGDSDPDSNSVRYFNTGSSHFHGIPPGEVGYLLSPISYGAGAKVSEYDNYPWWYAPSDDKFFWIFTSQRLAGDRGGIFDLPSRKWTHGNSHINAAQWPNGPYWSAYVKPAPVAHIINKDPANGFSEALDTAVALSRHSLFLIERNPNFPKVDSEPRRIRIENISGYPYKVNQEEHADYMNCGICVGEWFYFIRPATTAEASTYPNPRMREFWKVRLVPPYDQFKKLAFFPRFDINPLSNVAAGNYNDYSWGPLLVHDEPSNSILAIFDRLYVYDIDANVWSDRTTSNWQRCLYAVGGMKRSTREVFFRPGINVDLPSTSPLKSSWSKIALTGGVKPRARWVPTALEMAFPGYPTGYTPFGGKHRRFIYSNVHRKVDGSAVVGSPESGTTGGYVWVFGGDYQGVPYTNSQVPNYPTTSTWALDSGRQDQWRTPVQEINGKARIEMACNHVAFYPYPGGPDPATTQLGPAHPDGVGVVFDKRGDVWVGPGYYRWPIHTTPKSAGWIQPMAMYRFRLPGKHTDGVRKGNGWTLPPQNYLVTNGNPWNASTNPDGKVNADDIVVGNAPGNGLFGSSGVWTAYDAKDDAVVFASRGDHYGFQIFRFPCTPNNGRQVWARTQVTRKGGPSALHAFLNQYVRDGAKLFSDAAPASSMFAGHQVVINDDLYVVMLPGAGPYNGRNVPFLMRVNLRNHLDQEYISLPTGTHWCRGYDAPLGSNVTDSGVMSVNDFRDVQGMGHLIVFGPPADNYLPTDPWCYWFDTNRRRWTIGQTYSQMRAANPSLPATPYAVVPEHSSKGRMCCVPETGELWYPCMNGIVKYRIW